jgi:hypothetical protein
MHDELSSSTAALPPLPLSLEFHTTPLRSTLQYSVVPLNQDKSHYSSKTAAKPTSTSIIPSSSSKHSTNNSTTERSHHAIQKKQVSFLSRTVNVYDVNYVDSVDSEDSSSDDSFHHKEETIEKTGNYHHISAKSKYNTTVLLPDSEDSDDNSFGNAFDWLIKPERTLITHSNEKKDAIEEFVDFEEDDDDASMDADVDGTHGHLFLNSQSDDDDDDDNEEGEGDERCSMLSKRREQKARSKRKAYWNRKRKIDIVETSYCSNSQEVETVETKKYAGYLILGDDNCMRFPDGSQYRFR